MEDQILGEKILEEIITIRKQVRRISIILESTIKIDPDEVRTMQEQNEYYMKLKRSNDRKTESYRQVAFLLKISIITGLIAVVIGLISIYSN